NDHNDALPVFSILLYPLKDNFKSSTVCYNFTCTVPYQMGSLLSLREDTRADTHTGKRTHTDKHTHVHTHTDKTPWEFELGHHTGRKIIIIQSPSG
uniref:Uncharacterized protein n=1 Tax=Oncorhynchus kisutch TaxID=8019 RepID=A0A8C7LLU7_ONCKI